jgi:uncharacterized protein (DUF2141 family)
MGSYRFRFKTLIVILLFLSSISSFAQSVKTGIISINITNIKNTKGQINANLFKNAKGFPGNYKEAYKTIRTGNFNTGNIIIEFKDIEYGEYAVALIHDEDLNNELKTGLFGIPREGYGFSNNVKGISGPPMYNEAVIHLEKARLEISIQVNY